MRRTPATLLALSLTAVAVPAALVPSSAAAVDAGDPSATGVWGAPFEEAGERCAETGEGLQCKPAAGTLNTLPNGKFIYFDALDSIQEADVNVVAEFGDDARNDNARVLDLRGEQPEFTRSFPDEGLPPGKREAEFLPGPLHNDDEDRNDGALFCSDQVFLADGKILNVGGTHYYQEPGIPAEGEFGVVELEGLTNSRTYDPVENQWRASGEMTFGRWYPSVVTLPGGDVMAFSGVTKLIKPVYPERPLDSGRNVVQSERYDPETGEWTVDGGNKSLPLYPRLHLLPNGNVYYDAAGQTFNPAGQAYDEALWNTAASYDPETQTWRDLGLPAFGDALVGFRGSAFSAMLPLRPNEQGEYDTVQTLSAGGVYGVSPGTYLGTDTSTLNTITISEDGTEGFASEATAPLNNPRWYPTGVNLPTGEVIAFSGADRDEVVAPGSGTAETTPEMYDPETGTWTELADAGRGRTYHNTATLMADGRVLVGGHSPITTGYTVRSEVPQDVLGFSNPDRDPSFEIFSPPNLFYGPRPVITDVDPGLTRGETLRIATPDARDISSVTVVRNTTLTHLVDSDQRTVELPVVSRDDGSVTVAVSDNAAVLPDGPYFLFANKEYDDGETPSVGRQVFVGEVPQDLAADVQSNNTRTQGEELGARQQGSAPAAAGQPAAGTPTSSSPQPAADPASAPAVVQAAPVAVLDRVTAASSRSAVLPRTGSVPTGPAVAAALLIGAAVVSRRRLLRD